LLFLVDVIDFSMVQVIPVREEELANPEVVVRRGRY